MVTKRKLKKHPLKQLMDAGVPVTISSDDPTLFGTTLSQEYAICLQEFIDDEEKYIVLGLFNDFNDEMKLDDPFEPVLQLSPIDTQEINEYFKNAFIESVNISNFCAVEYKYKKVITNPNNPDIFQITTIPIKSEVWKEQN